MTARACPFRRLCAALLQSLPEIKILSRAWAEENGASTPAAMREGKENFATLNANGTGPFRLVLREPQVRTVMAANPDWWDTAEHDVAEATWLRIANDATRIAALLSGEVDFAYPVPLQDVGRVERTEGLDVLVGPEIRVMFLSMDQHRDALAYGSVTDANPLKDRRVRQAIAHAIDTDAIVERIMLGAGAPTGGMIAPDVFSVAEETTRRRYAHDPDKARALLAEAGYGDGFAITLDCPNDRYINDERVCQAIASMLARVGIDVTVAAIPSARFFQKIGARDTSFNFFGYTPVNRDAFNTLNVILHSPTEGAGQWNVGNYSNPEVDALIAKVLKEPDPERREALVTAALEIHAEDAGHIPLYLQGLSWGMREGVRTPLMTDNRVVLRHFRIE